MMWSPLEGAYLSHANFDPHCYGPHSAICHTPFDHHIFICMVMMHVTSFVSNSRMN